MKDIKRLLTTLKHHIDNATDIDSDGVEYFVDHTIAACDIKDIADMLGAAEKALENKVDERVWEIYCKMVASHRATGKSNYELLMDEARKAVSVFNAEFDKK